MILTTNYALKKRETGDNIKNDLLVVYPENLDKIDTQMKVNENAITDHASTVEGQLDAMSFQMSLINLAVVINSSLIKINNATIGTDVNEFTQESVDTFTQSINTAQAVSENPTTKVQTDEAIATLKSDKELFLLSRIPEGDPAALLAEISSAQTLHDQAVEGEYDGQYMSGSKAELQTAIDAAQLVLDDEFLDTQEELGVARSALTVAVSVFGSKIIHTDNTVLQSVITNATNILTSAVEGEYDGHYVVGSKAILQSSIDDAQLVLDTSATKTQAELDSAVTTLESAITEFETNRIVVDVSLLESALTNALSVHDNAVVGTEPSNYSQESLDTLSAAITSAQLTVTNKDTKTQADIDSETTALTDAVATFEASVIPVV